MAEARLQAQVDIDFPVAKTRCSVNNFARMPQCRLMNALGSLSRVTRTTNLNRRHFSSCPTTSIVTDVIREKRLAFRGTAENTIWRYELEPTANRARLADGRHAENGSKAVAEP